MSKKVTLAVLPECDFCADKAQYDGKTTLGPWAFMCSPHYSKYGVGLGTGVGQELVLGEAHRVTQESGK